jgi:hypothetical protein
VAKLVSVRSSIPQLIGSTVTVWDFLLDHRHALAAYAQRLQHQGAGRAAWLAQVCAEVYGVPYYWAGNDPVRGFDCTGLTKFLRERVLPAAGVLPPLARAMPRVSDDQGSAYPVVPWDQRQVGDLIIYGENNDARHATMVLHPWIPNSIIGANGGGSRTRANETDAFVRVVADSYDKNSIMRVVRPA